MHGKTGPMITTNWLTQKEAATYASVDRHTLYRAVKAGLLRVGRPRTTNSKATKGRASTIRFKAAWIDAWMERVA